MTEDELKRAMARAWQELPPDGPLSDQDRKKFWIAIENLLPYLPRTDPQEGDSL